MQGYTLTRRWNKIKVEEIDRLINRLRILLESNALYRSVHDHGSLDSGAVECAHRALENYREDIKLMGIIHDTVAEKEGGETWNGTNFLYFCAYLYVELRTGASFAQALRSVVDKHYRKKIDTVKLSKGTILVQYKEIDKDDK